MGTTSTYFGGSGGGSAEPKVTPRAGFIQNPTYLNNTELTTPQSGSNDRAYITPIDDQYFYILSSGSGASSFYAQIYQLNSDDTVSLVASQLIGDREPRAFVCSGTNALSSSWNGSRPIVDKLVWNGSSTITKTQLSDTIARPVNESSHIGTVLNDNRLLLCVPQMGSGGQYVHYFQMDTDGTTGQVINKSTNFQQTDDNTYHAGCGTGDGIYIAGRNGQNTDRLNGLKIYPRLNSTSEPDSGEAYAQQYQQGAWRYVSMMPLAQGGVVGSALSNGGTGSTSVHRMYFTQSGYQPAFFMNRGYQDGSGSAFGSLHIPEQSTTHGNIQYPLQRRYNGSYQDKNFKLAFIDDSNNMFPVAKDAWYSMRRTVGSNSTLSGSQSSASTCLMGDKVLVLMRDTSNLRFNVNVWRLA